MVATYAIDVGYVHSRLDNTGITEAGKKLLEEASKQSKSGVEVTFIPNIHLRRKLEKKTINRSNTMMQSKYATK